MARRWALAALALATSVFSLSSAFTCQGPTYAEAVANCPDRGAQEMSSGGSVTVRLINATHLPNKDSTGPSAGVSDPYVRITAGSVTVRSSTVLNDLNPSWNEDVSLGFLGSATLLTIEIWDADSGLEFGDDLLVKSTVRVPFCSTFHANTSALACDDPFNCAASDSLWSMPERKMCSEPGFLNFNTRGSSCASGKGLCLFFEFHLVPFQMEVDVSYPKAQLKTPVPNALGTPTSLAKWTTAFGQPFLETSLSLDASAVESTALRGALMLRSSTFDRSFGKYNAIKFYASVNFAATIFVCRPKADNANGVPGWILSEYDDRYVNIYGLQVQSAEQPFGCFVREVDGTRKNEWGGVESGAMAFRTNTLPGRDANTNADKIFYEYNYIVLATPRVVAPREENIQISYEMSQFLNFFGSYGLIWCWFMFLVARFLRKINFRIDRISNYVAARVLTGDDRNVLAGLLLSLNQSPCNVEYRSHLYHTKNIIVFCVFLPLGLLMSWGISVAVKVQPPALGLALFFVGSALIFAWFAFRLWETSLWRLSALSTAALGASVSSLALFFVTALFVDPAVLHYGNAVDIAGLSLIFGSINCVPCILLIFKQDRSMALYLELVVTKVAEAVHAIKSPNPPASNAPLPALGPKDLQINRVLHGLLGDKYSINPKLPALKFSGVMSEINMTFNTAMHGGAHPASAVDDEEEETLLERLLTEERKLYGFACFILFVYFVIAAATTASPSLAFLNICALTLLDIIHLSMSKGDNAWSPGFKALLLILGRMLICGSTVSLWMLNYSACYVLYAMTLIHELIQGVLPTISARKAGEIVFGGGESINLIRDLLRTTDMSGGPGFSLGLLSLTFLAVIVIASFAASGPTTATTALLVPTLTVWGTPWRIYVFAIAAFLAALVAGLMMATQRAFSLESHGLLQGWARETYIFRREIRLPLILALSVEGAILLSGLLLYALSQTAAVLVGAVFIPAICLSLGIAYQSWVRNDYTLVPWPRQQKVERPESPLLMAEAAALTMSAGGVMVPYAKETYGSRPPSSANPNGDLEQAFNMIENLFGSHDNNNINNMTLSKRAASPWVTTKPLAMTATASDLVLGFEDDADNPETEGEGLSALPKTLKGFALPPLKVTGSKVEKEIKMPPLPLKSVLRRKRQNMGVKVQSQVPLVADLRARDGAVSADQFGNKEVVFDVNDPWAQFEMTEEEELLMRKNKKKGTVAKQAVSKGPSEGLYRRMAKAVKRNSYLNMAYHTISGWLSYFQSTAKVYPSNYAPDLEHEHETGDHELDLNVDEGDVVDSAAPVSSEGLGVLGGPSGKSSSTKVAGSKKTTPTGATEGKPPGASAAADDDEVVDVDKLTYSQAFWMGHLNREEYTAVLSWYSGLLAIMLFGITLGAVTRPRYMGFVIWVALWLLLLLGVPMYKYFQTYTFDTTSKNMVYFAGLLYFLFCVIFFAVELEGDIGRVGSLWIFDFLVYLPVFAYILFSALQWADAGFRGALLDRNGDGTVSLREVLQFLQTFPALLVLVVLFMWQLYIWIDITAGLVFTLAVIVSVIAYVYLRDWADNDHFLSPELVSFAQFMIHFTMFISFCVGVLREHNPVFALSVFFFAWMSKHCLALLGKLLVLDRGAVFYFAPFLFPIYSFDPTTRDVSEESDAMKGLLAILALAAVWGCCLTVFLYPMHIGIAVSCGIVLFGSALVILCISFVPRQLAKCQALIDADIVRDSAELAKTKCDDRQLPLNLEMKNFEMDLPDDVLEAAAPQKSLLDKLKERTCLENCVAIMSDLRSLKYVREDKRPAAADEDAAAVAGDEDADEYEQTVWQKLVIRTKAFMRDLYELLPISRMAGYRRHSQAPFGFKDLLLEVFFTGRGPFGVLGPEGMWYRFLLRMRDTRDFKWMYGRWIDSYDTLGNDLSHVQLDDYVDYPTILARNLDVDKALDFAFKEETRCAVHFLLSVLVSADTKLQRETVLFQKFLRENRYRLAANGIAPPKEIFSSDSYASINIPLVAVWLTMLTADEQARFHTLKHTFNQEQRERDALIASSDAEAVAHASALRERHLQRDDLVLARLSLELVQHRERRIQLFAESLDGPERVKFMQRKELWTHDYDCYVDMKDMDMYERFKAACLAERNEMLENAVHQLIEIEAAQRDIRLGEYGRAYQFVDSEFPPSEYSLGEGEGASYVLGWRCAPGVVENMQLFDGGTHPDDVCEGVFKDTWLLSAVSMLLAAGEFGKGLINERIRSLFVPHPGSADNEPTLDTQVGAYCVRIHRNSDWIPVIVDDLLPMRRAEHWTSENRGVANAHCREGRGLWLPMIEKAFAKYYGSYAMLERGHVHHALEDLTGCEAECVHLSSYARGVNKRALWDTLLRYKRNGYILGAGTGEAVLADREIQDMGIVFNTAYTIYDVREVDGHHLLKLRNPPGDHDEWKGDWSDHSRLWTRRLKAKLGYSDDEHDNTFFMSFDDFVSVFRALYVCKYYSPHKWIESKWMGFWKRPDESAVEQMDLMNQFIAEQGDSLSSASKPAVDQASMDRKKAKARLNSAGGLPSRHNPACVLECNPHYSLRIFRPTDLNVTVTQYNAKGVRSLFKPVPFSVLIVRNDHPDVARRLTSIRREDVLFSTGEPQATKTQSLYVSSLKPGLYVVLVGAYLAGMEGHFNISVMSNYRAEFLPIWPPAWMLRDDKAAKDKAKTGGKASLLDVTASIEKGFGASASMKQTQKRVSHAGAALRQGLRSLFGKGDDPMDEEEDPEDVEGGEAER